MPPKCPYCNAELKYAKLCHAQNKENYYYETWEGYCPICNKTFFWDEITFHIVTIWKEKS